MGQKPMSYPLLGKEVGPSRGVMDTGRYGVSPSTVPPGFMPVGQNLLFTAAGGFEPRPGVKCHARLGGSLGPSNCTPTLLKLVSTSDSAAYWVFAGVMSATNYVWAELASETLLAKTTADAAATGATRGATCGALFRVGGEIALVMTHSNGTTAPWYLRLPTKTVGNVAATGGLPAAVQYATVVATAGNRLWLAKGCTIHYSLPNGDLTLGTSFDASDYITPGIQGNPADDVVAMFEFGDWLVAMSRRRAYLIPLDNPQNYTTALDYAAGKAQEFGIVGVNAWSMGDGVVYFCTGRDLMAWSPGVDTPRSLTRAENLTTVAGRFLDTQNTWSDCAVGYDPIRKVALFSYAKDGATYNNHTLAWDVDRSAWCDWTFGSDVYAKDDTPSSLTGKRLWLALNVNSSYYGCAPCTLDRNKATDDAGVADVDATAAVNLQPDSSVAVNMLWSTHELSQPKAHMQVKAVSLMVDAVMEDGTPLSRGVVSMTTKADGDDEVDWQEETIGGAASFDGDVFGSAVMGGAREVEVNFAPDMHSAQGKSLAFHFAKQDGLPIRVLSATALVRVTKEGRLNDET